MRIEWPGIETSNGQQIRAPVHMLTRETTNDDDDQGGLEGQTRRPTDRHDADADGKEEEHPFHDEGRASIFNQDEELDALPSDRTRSRLRRQAKREKKQKMRPEKEREVESNTSFTS